MMIRQCEIGFVNSPMVQVGVSFSDGKHKHAVFKCRCGKRKILRIDHVRSGRTQNCGCKYGASTHRQSYSRVYRVWQGMNQRCGNKKAANFPRYGGRGITVCEEWKKSFEQFLSDMGEPENSEMQLDRIDNNRGYCKTNCRWVTRSENQQNRRNSKRNVR
jgi:hypothetical protein